MRFGHGRWPEDVALLAAGVLSGAEKDAAEAHAAACAECGAELGRLRAALDTAAGDGIRDAELPIPLQALVTRVTAEIDSRLAAPAPAGRWPARAVWSAAALAAAALVVMMMVSAAPPRGPETAHDPDAGDAPRVAVDAEALRRMESTLAREQAARYLSDAQDVLVTVAAHPRPCEDGHDHVDVDAEARRSRELLERRALVVDLHDPGVQPARPVLDDVESVLREVASLEGCVRAGDVEALHRDIERRHLLMKIRLMTRELAG